MSKIHKRFYEKSKNLTPRFGIFIENHYLCNQMQMKCHSSVRERQERG